MDSSLSPRDIQNRVRGGASVEDVARASGMPVERVQVFAGPVIAEREHMARMALGATVRRRGEGTGHRRLQEIITDRLRARGLDADTVTWDSWREQDLRWRVVGTLAHDSGERVAEFLFDTKGRFSVADNNDARWMIGEDVPGDPENENTVDFDDELALVRATQSPAEPQAPVTDDDVPQEMFPDAPQTSELDELYDMLSGVSEDSVRIYIGLDDDEPAQSGREDEPSGAPEPDDERRLPDDVPLPIDEEEGSSDEEETPEPEPEPSDDVTRETETDEPAASEAQQDSLISDDAAEPTQPPKKKSRRRRAQVPSWDEIMFGK